MSNWLTYSPVSGHGNATITITASTLTGLEDRIATLIATGTQGGQTLSASTVITQKYLTLTEIYFENLTWVTDIAGSGGTATKDNCSFSIIAKYSDNSTEDITSEAEVTGSLVVPLTTADTRQLVGTLTLTATYEDKTCTGSVEVYQKVTSPLASQYLTFDITSAGRIYWRYKSGNNPRYSKDSGATWNMLSSDISVSENEKVLVKADSGGAFGSFSGSTAGFKLSGNIMSLVSGSSFENLDTITATGMCMNMFRGCTGLTDASDLLLPATTLSRYCYRSMFYNCTSLTTAPELPATALTNYCYQYMFKGCTSLTTAPELPATTLANDCYQYMFYNCSSLTTAPELPANTLTQYCYRYMFAGCTSLTTAPALPAMTLKSSCYDSMFNNCASLKYIKCLATDISATDCTYRWVDGVASTGTFIKSPDMSRWIKSSDGIPTGWTVINAS